MGCRESPVFPTAKLPDVSGDTKHNALASMRPQAKLAIDSLYPLHYWWSQQL